MAMAEAAASKANSHRLGKMLGCCGTIVAVTQGGTESVRLASFLPGSEEVALPKMPTPPNPTSLFTPITLSKHR